jgi:glutamine amidotransferase
MIAIIDYGIGNLHSVRSAFESVVDVDVVLTSDPDVLASADRIVLPGVGTFAAGAENLENSGLGEVVRTHVLQKGQPLLGICLGMQLLATSGEEGGDHAGLGLIPGTVQPLAPLSDVRLPHTGWNDIDIKGSCPVMDRLGREPTFYFVHSYQLIPDDPSVVVATVDYGGPVVAAVTVGSVIATQFHPEKSQQLGLKLIENFVSWTP